MTGFSRSETQTAKGDLIWELRSVNHRYLDVSVRVPDGFRHLEPELRQAISERLGRGKVDATLTVRESRSAGGAMKLNLALAEELIGHIEALATKIKQPAHISPLSLLRWPGVLEETAADPDEWLPAVTSGLESAIAGLCESRDAEGEKVHVMLESRCAEVEKLVAEVSARLPDVVAAVRDRMAERIRSLKVDADPERLEQELAIVAQKLDVSEELDRLRAHVAEVRSAFQQKEPVGRRLDFLMQELNREANTLASKSADTETTQRAVDLKVTIEQMREQVQNVE